jgi:predicted RNase H-like HicB family nuclease
MKTIKNIVFKEGKYYVSQCLNVDISSYGKTVEEASSNLREALDLYFEDEPAHRITSKPLSHYMNLQIDSSRRLDVKHETLDP